MELSNIGAEEIYRHSFKCPANMIDKMKIFIDLVKTDPTESDDMLLKKVVPVSQEMLQGNNSTTSFKDSSDHPGGNSNTDHNDLLNDMKSESGVSEEDLGFLQSMNLSSLVREFEMEAASGQGSQHLGILSLANYDEVDGVGPDEHPFSELVPEETEDDQHVHHPGSNTNGGGNSLNDIEFE